MRRMAGIALLFLLTSSCGTRAVVVNGGLESPFDHTPPLLTTPPGSTSVRMCREITRLSCDISRCKGKNLDLVTFNCGGKKVERCEAGKGGC